MAALTGTITHTALHAEFENERANLNTASALGPFAFSVDFHKRSVGSSDDISLRSIIWTPRDDFELLVLGAEGYGDTGTQITTCTLEAVGITVTDGTVQVDTSPLLEEAVNVSVTSTGTGFFSARQDYEAPSGVRHWLLKGITYRLSLSVDTGTMDSARGFAFLGAQQRRPA